jgi:putative PIN family toxin of toxin-antitoxin system
MKVVLDTNVLIDGFRDDYSYEKQIIDEIRTGKIEAFANRQTLQENKLILSRLVDNPQYERELNDFFSQITMVVNRRKIHVVRDPEDNKILESAVEAGAEYLITKDSDLLDMKKYEDIQMISPQAFWVRYKDEGTDLWQQWTGFISGK